MQIPIICGAVNFIVIYLEGNYSSQVINSVDSVDLFNKLAVNVRNLCKFGAFKLHENLFSVKTLNLNGCVN